MFDTILKEMVGYFDKRFVSTIFLPCLAFSLTLTALVCYAEGADRTLALWKAQPIEVQAFLIIVYLSVVYLLAYMLLTFLGIILRTYEGYPGWVKRLLRSRTEYYRKNLVQMCRCWDELDDELAGISEEREAKAGEYDAIFEELEKLKADRSVAAGSRVSELRAKSAGLKKEVRGLDVKIGRRQTMQSALDNEKHFYYPPCIDPGSVLPTRLGNILKSAEYYPQIRYNLDGSLIWPRLYPVLPDGYKDMIAEKKGSLDMLLAVSVLSVAFALAGGAYFLLLRPSWPLFLLTFCGGFLLWWLSYKSATEVTLGYGALIRVGYDLHRGELLKALRLKKPASLSEEKALWHKVCQLIYYGDDIDFDYDGSGTPEEPAPKKG